MYQTEPVYAAFPIPEPEPITYVDRFRAWVTNRLNSLWDLLLSAVIPILQLFALMCAIAVLSIIFNTYLRRVMVPKALIHEKVYFNHVSETPFAKIRLHTAMQQWVYVKSQLALDGGTKRRFLKADSFYDIHGVFTVAKSARNYDIGTSALTVKTLDASGDLVAKSVRALIIPYQHPMSLLLESVAFFPARVLGAVQVAETVDVWVDLMGGYHEPGYALPPTDAIELYLNAPVMDLQYAYITVMPKLRGVVYYMYYYPWISFIIGCVLVSGVQVFLYAFVGMAILTLRYFYQTINSPDPLAQQYAQRRARAAFPSTTSAPFTTRLNTTVDRGTTDNAFGHAAADSWEAALREPRASTLQVPVEQDGSGNRFRTSSGHSTAGNTVSGNMRQFVATHRPSAMTPETKEEEDDELIDTINADLMSSRDRNRARSLSNDLSPRTTFTSNTSSRVNNSSAVPRANNTITTQAHTVSGLRAALNDSPATPDSHDWDTNFRTPQLTTSISAHRGVGGGSADRARSRNSSNFSSSSDTDTSATYSGVGTPTGTPSGTLSFDSARGVRGGVGSAYNQNNLNNFNNFNHQSDVPNGSPRHTNASTDTPSSTTSSNSYAYSEFSENDSEVPDENGLVRVFENDFFNRFFPFLGRKGSMFGEDEYSRGNKKKR